MLTWLKHWLAYVLISGGLVLLFVPLRTHRMVDIEKDFLFLENSENLLAAKKPTNTKTSTIVNPYGYPMIQPEGLAHYSSLSKEINTIQRIWSGNIHLTRLDNVPIEEWDSFKKDFGISEKHNAFQYGKYIFKGYVKADNVSLPVEVKNLKVACKLIGILFLIFGFYVLSRSYIPPSDGIRIGKKSAIIIWDIIIILVGIPFTWWFVEFVLTKGFQTATEWGEDFAVGMGVFWVVLAYPVLAFITTATSIQTLCVTGSTIVLKGLFGTVTVPWSDVESIYVSQAYSPRKVGSVPAPHRVMKTLEIRAKTSTLRVLEPPYASTKKEIIDELMKHAPDKIKPNIITISKEWLSKW